jgi:hypothetical protein
MARKDHNPENPQAAQTHNGVDTSSAYVLDPNRWLAVASKIYTMKLDTDQGEVSVPKANLVDESDKKNPRYRFARRVAVPAINAAAVTDKDSLLNEISTFIDNLAAYDASTGLSNEAIKGFAKGPDGLPLLDERGNPQPAETKVIPRPILICVNGKGDPISPIEYVRRLLLESNTLSVQKQLQKPLRDHAESILMSELNLNPPAGRTRKIKESGPPADADAAFDTLG